jgi:hypothetical protein
MEKAMRLRGGGANPGIDSFLMVRFPNEFILLTYFY